MAGAEDKPAFALVMAVAEAEHLTVVVVLRAAPDAAAIFPEHPHIEGRVAIVLEVEGAPPAQAASTGKRLPAIGQSHGNLPRRAGTAMALTRQQSSGAANQQPSVMEKTRSAAATAGFFAGSMPAKSYNQRCR